MGSGGSRAAKTISQTVTQTNVNPTGTPIQQQVPDDTNTTVQPSAIDNITSMTDNGLAQLYRDSMNTQLPNQLNDVADITQRFVYTAGLNEKPLVLDSAQFDQYLKDNNISNSEIMARSVNDITYTNAFGTKVKLTQNQIADMLKYSKFNYIGGKVGGQAYGAGTYFDMNGGRNTGYGGTTIQAVLNPKTARVIEKYTLISQAKAFDKSHPDFAKVTGGINTSFRGNNLSVYALAMGYNVISENGPSYKSGYYNVIDRKALVIKG